MAESAPITCTACSTSLTTFPYPVHVAAKQLGGACEFITAARPVIEGAEEVDAAEQRAVELMCDVSEDWRPGLRDAVAYAWRVLSDES